MISIDATVLGATTYKEVREARKEQQAWHQEGTEATSAMGDGVNQLHEAGEKLSSDISKRLPDFDQIIYDRRGGNMPVVALIYFVFG
jgi:hypothetical protein